MATFLDVGIMKHLGGVFTFILVFSIVYALLEYKRFLGDKQRGLRAIIAFVVAIFTASSPGSTAFISFITPWFFVLVLVAFLILMVMFMFGETEEHVARVVREKEVFWYVLIFVIIIVLFGLGNIYGQGLLSSVTTTDDTDTGDGTGDDSGSGELTVSGGTGSTATTSYSQNVAATLVHPKILGLLLIMAIAIFAVMFLTKPIMV